MSSISDMAESMERLEENQEAQAEITKDALNRLDGEINEISKLSMKRSEVRGFLRFFFHFLITLLG